MAKLCPQCEKENPSVANVCMHCGTRLVENTEMDKMDVLHNELSDAKDTIKVLKDALKEKEKQEEMKVKVKEKAFEQKDVNLLPPPPEPEVAQNKTFPHSVLVVGLILLLVVVGSICYSTFYKPYAIDRDAPRYYTFAGNTFLRSTQEVGVEYNKLGTVPYGSELIMYNNGFDWSEVKWKNNQTNKAIKGYISSTYVLPAGDFRILNSIWGDNESKKIINTTKCRIALLNYFKERDLHGWKVYSKGKDSKYNTTYYKRVLDANSKFTDFAVILKNENSDERRCLLFTFSDDETPRLIYEEDAPSIGDIYSISSDNKTYPYSYQYHITYR